MYQKTRFATDARPTTGAAPNSQTPATNGKQERKKSFGESFRRLVGKFTGGHHGSGGNKSDADRKKNRKKHEPAERRHADSGDDYDYRDDEHDYRDDGDDENTYRSYDGGVRPAATDRSNHQRLFGSTQTLDRHRAGRTNYKTTRNDDHRPEESTNTMNGGSRTLATGNGGGVHRYYLGEDPFGGSIYGREREYDGTSYKRRHSKKNGGHHDSSPHHHSTHYVQR